MSRCLQEYSLHRAFEQGFRILMSMVAPVVPQYGPLLEIRISPLEHDLRAYSRIPLCGLLGLFLEAQGSCNQAIAALTTQIQPRQLYLRSLGVV